MFEESTCQLLAARGVIRNPSFAGLKSYQGSKTTSENASQRASVEALAIAASSQAAGVTKLFDVLAEPSEPCIFRDRCQQWLLVCTRPKGIVARLLFELGGHRQARRSTTCRRLGPAAKTGIGSLRNHEHRHRRSEVLTSMS